MLPEGDRDDAGLTLTATYDSRDTPFNPTRVSRRRWSIPYVDDALGADLDWERLEVGLAWPSRCATTSLWMTLAGGSDLEQRPARRPHISCFGGPGSFPGFELGELRSTDYWTASGSYLWKIKDIMSIRGQALYAGVRLEAGQAFDRLESRILPGLLRTTKSSTAGPCTYWPHTGRPADGRLRGNEHRVLEPLARVGAPSATARSSSAASSAEPPRRAHSREGNGASCSSRCSSADGCWCHRRCRTAGSSSRCCSCSC